MLSDAAYHKCTVAPYNFSTVYSQNNNNITNAVKQVIEHFQSESFLLQRERFGLLDDITHSNYGAGTCSGPGAWASSFVYYLYSRLDVTAVLYDHEATSPQ